MFKIWKSNCVNLIGRDTDQQQSESTILCSVLVSRPTSFASLGPAPFEEHTFRYLHGTVSNPKIPRSRFSAEVNVISVGDRSRIYSQ